MSTLFVWTGTIGPLWDSAVTNSDGTQVTNWKNVSTGKTDVIPTSDTGDVAQFNDGGIHTVGVDGDSVDQLTVEHNTSVTFTGGRFKAGAFIAADNAEFPDDLVVDDGSKLVVASGAGLQNQGTVDVIGLGNDLFGGSGDGTLEVDPGGLYETQALIIGDGTAGVGFVSIHSALIFTVITGETGNGELTIGQLGKGSLDVTATPNVFLQSTVLGLNQGAVGAMTLDSSILGGSDMTIGAAGVGHVTIGAGATVALLDIVVGSAQSGSGDLLVTGPNNFMVDFLTIGVDGTGTATFGAGSTGLFTSVTVGESADAVANLTMDGSVWTDVGALTIGLSGTGHATAGAGEVVTAADVVLGSGQNASGDLTVDNAVLNGGTVVIGHDGTGDLAIGSGSSGSVSTVVVAEDAGSSGTLTIDGADWSIGSLTVGLTGTGLAAVENGASATLDNVLIGPNGELDVAGAAGSAGTVIAQQVTIDFGTLDVSQSGQVVIGAGTGADGAVAIGNNSSLTGLGLLKGDVVLSSGGLVQATAAVPGALKIDGNISGAGTIAPLMTLEVNGGIGGGIDIAFSGSVGAQVGDLVLDVPVENLGTITGFGVGNTIDIRGSLYSNAVFMQGTSASAGTLTLSGGVSPPLSLLVEGNYASNSFHATPGTSDTIVTVMPCFAAGTRVETERGMVAVEALREGDRVQTLLGDQSHPVTWLGYRRVDCLHHPDPQQVWPICVCAGAFGPARPYRDLFLSPDHALYDDGVLIPVSYLVNGRTIFQVARNEVTYWHVELAEHNVLYAEGVPTESYLDTGNRSGFANGGPIVDLHPDFATQVWDARACAPLVVTGPELAAAKRRLLVRASAQGYATTGDPALAVLANGKERPARIEGRTWRVQVPRTATGLRLVSRAWCPAHMQADNHDLRTLGVAISRLQLDGGEVDLDSAALSTGWHAREQGWRWSNGDATLVTAGARRVAFEVAMTGTYWQGDAHDFGRVLSQSG